MKSLIVSFFAVFVSLIAVPALASNGSGFGSESNFSYSRLGVELGKATLDEDLDFFGERYEDFGVGVLTGSYQVDDNLAIGVGITALTNDGPRTEITNSSLTIALQVPVPIGERVDIVPQFGFGRFETELCYDNICATDDDSAALFGLAIRAWAVPDVLELSAGVFDSTLEESEASVALGLGLWAAEHHRFGLNYEDSDSLSVVTVGYSYNW